MNTEHATPELFDALAKAQAEVENAAKSSTNPHFKSRYADLAEVLNTVRPVFAKHGLSLWQAPSFDGALASVTTMIAHSSGGYVTSKASCVPGKSDAQQIGSTTTYLRRYALAAMCGIAQEDDDGNSVAHNQKPAELPVDVVQAIADAESLESLRALYKGLPKAQQQAAVKLIEQRKNELNEVTK